MARSWLRDGVRKGEMNGLAVIGDSTGMQIKVGSGEAWIKGHWYRSDAERTLAIAAAHATLARIDRVVAEVDWSTNLMTVKVLTGTPAASPSAPALTQSDLVLWQITLATVAIAAAVSTITAANVTDGRAYALPEMRGIPAVRAYRATDQSIPDSVFTAISFSAIREDRYRMWSAATPTRLTVPVAGLYSIGATGEFAAAASAYRAIARLRLNGTTYIAARPDSVATGHEGSASVICPPYPLAIGDYIEWMVHQNSGGAINVASFGNYSPEIGMALEAQTS